MGNNVQYHVSLPETRYPLYRVFFVFRDAVPVPSPRAALIDPEPNIPECRVCDGRARAAQHWTADPGETLVPLQ